MHPGWPLHTPSLTLALHPHELLLHLNEISKGKRKDAYDKTYLTPPLPVDDTHMHLRERNHMR